MTTLNTFTVSKDTIVNNCILMLHMILNGSEVFLGCYFKYPLYIYACMHKCISFWGGVSICSLGQLRVPDPLTPPHISAFSLEVLGITGVPTMPTSLSHLVVKTKGMQFLQFYSVSCNCGRKGMESSKSNSQLQTTTTG